MVCATDHGEDVLRKIYTILSWLDDLASKVDEEGKAEIKKFKEELERLFK